jgi:PAP2 superfamily
MLNWSEAIYAFFLSILLIVAGYQFYFLPQRRPIKNANIGIASRLDEKFPFRPQWVWIYSIGYYPYILSTILTLSSIGDFYSTCVSYVALLFFHIIISYIYPVRTPAKWRSYSATCISSRFLKFVQRIDKGGNCFPSMHVAVATLTAIHITANRYNEASSLILIVWMAPILISASALYTKQHFFADIIPGVVLAFFVYYGFELLVLANSVSFGVVSFGCLGVASWFFLTILFLARFQPHNQQMTVAATETATRKLVGRELVGPPSSRVNLEMRGSLPVESESHSGLLKRPTSSLRGSHRTLAALTLSPAASHAYETTRSSSAPTPGLSGAPPRSTRSASSPAPG